jgi:hypothetical protein
MPVRAVGQPAAAAVAVFTTLASIPRGEGVSALTRAIHGFSLIAGALFPALVGFKSATMLLGAAIGLFAGIAYVVVIIAVLLLPETRGKQLAVYD